MNVKYNKVEKYKETKRRKKLYAFMPMCLCTFLFSFGFCKGIGSSDIILQKLSSARILSLAESYVSLEGVEAMNYNPAGIVSKTPHEFSISYQKGFIDDSFSLLMYSNKFSFGYLGVGIGYSDAGMIELIDIDGNESNVRGKQDLVVISSVADSFEELSYGIGLKLIYSRIVEKISSFAFACDAGLIIHTEHGINFGLSIRNFGIGQKFIEKSSNLPLIVQTGFSYEWQLHPSHCVLFSLNGAYFAYEEELQTLFGIEYSFSKIFYLRFGYKYSFDYSSFTYGLGFSYPILKKLIISFDYFLTPNPDLGNSHFVTLSVKL
jgi:hypothetical protein